ncbi:unnamed protein product [Amoebophrya sp. A25]|nr:unnamed protein product [Amoebophrya sp. A25]|eukprot:GSA25T00019713001.1
MANCAPLRRCGQSVSLSGDCRGCCLYLLPLRVLGFGSNETSTTHKKQNIGGSRLSRSRVNMHYN